MKDGGGVRGFAALLILKRLMETIGEIETGNDDPHNSSFHPHWSNSNQSEPPGAPSPPQSTAVEEPTDSLTGGLAQPRQLTGYLPCHYFDYIFGTSTGGYAYSVRIYSR